MKAWKEAEWSLLETERKQLRVSASYPVLPAHRTRWSDRFQNALRLGEADADQIQAKYTEILQICQDFIETASAVALVLVREFYLPVRAKSILPVTESPIDGRKDNIRSTSRLKYEAHDILFKICTDDHGRFESSHEYAAKPVDTKCATRPFTSENSVPTPTSACHCSVRSISGISRLVLGENPH